MIKCCVRWGVTCDKGAFEERVGFDLVVVNFHDIWCVGGSGVQVASTILYKGYKVVDDGFVE